MISSLFHKSRKNNKINAAREDNKVARGYVAKYQATYEED